MINTPLNAAHLQSLLRSSPVLLPLVKKIWEYNANTLVVSFDISGQAASIDLAIAPSGQTVSGSVLGRDPQMQRQLRNCLVGKARLVIDSSERHLLGSWSVLETKPMIKEIAAWIHWLQQEGATSPSEYAPSLPLPPGHASLYWWDKRSNFGDAVGPWLIEQMTDLTPTNARNTKIPNRPLLTVGSIIGQLPRDGADIWGSGLIAPLEGTRLENLSKFSDIKVHAVRGRATRDELISKLGWNVPQVYGDPALLLPRFLVPEGNQPTEDKISVVPHYVHAKYFKTVSGESLHVVDVRQGLETVVNEIASSRVCISTSLHGVIIAQAYNVPWVWLRIHDHKLGGDQFKFNDFFSTLDSDAVAEVTISGADLRTQDFTKLTRNATLPRLNISLDALAAALPLPQSASHSTPWAPPALAFPATEQLARLISAQRTRLRKAKALVLHPRRGVVAVTRRLKHRRSGKETSRDAVYSQEPELTSMARELRKQNQMLREIHEVVTTFEGKRRLGTGDDG